MTYISQEKKKELAPGIKAVLKKYKMKGTIATRHYSTLIVNIKSGPIDFDLEKGYTQVNTYHIEKNYEGIAKQFLLELKKAMMIGNWDNSDLHSDYFYVGWYIDINIGKYDKPYEMTNEILDMEVSEETEDEIIEEPIIEEESDTEVFSSVVIDFEKAVKKIKRMKVFEAA